MAFVEVFLHRTQALFHEGTFARFSLHVDPAIGGLALLATQAREVLAKALAQLRMLGLAVRVEGFLVDRDPPARTAIVFTGRPDAAEAADVTGDQGRHGTGKVENGHGSAVKWSR